MLFRYQWVEVEAPRPRDPHLLQWGELMHCHGAGQKMFFPPPFFVWLHQLLIIVEHWAYAGTDF